MPYYGQQPPKPPAITRWQHRDLDGTWNRILPDGTLERRDPNDGQDMDPAKKCRHQWRVDAESGDLLYRRLPPESVGDAWRDTGVPEWEPRDPYAHDDLLEQYYERVAL